MYFILMNENRTIKPVDVVLRGGEGDKGEQQRR
jgi:hypothetical protein